MHYKQEAIEVLQVLVDDLDSFIMPPGETEQEQDTLASLQESLDGLKERSILLLQTLVEEDTAFGEGEHDI